MVKLFVKITFMLFHKGFSFVIRLSTVLENDPKTPNMSNSIIRQVTFY